MADRRTLACRIAAVLAGLLLSLVAILPCAAQGTGASIDETAISVTLYVDPTNGNDGGSGTSTSPLKTVNRAISIAAGNLYRGTKIWLGDGVYRESINLKAWNANSPTAPLILQAIHPGRAVISGSDVWTGWVSSGGGTYAHQWPYAWGYTAPPSGWPLPSPSRCPSALGCIVERREMVFVNGVSLTQKLTGSLTSPGTFTVVDGGSITIWPPTGTDIRTARVEVATRSGLLRSPYGIVNLVIRGIVFQHDNTALNGIGDSAVTVSGNNLLIDACQFLWNNFVGLDILSSHNVTVRNSQAEHSGENGVTMWQMRNVLFSGNEASYNNWRSFAGGLIGFDANGTKGSHVHGATFSHYTAIANQAGGLWLDTDNENILINNGLFARNSTNGLFVEISQGPIAIESNIMCNNQKHGMQTANSTQVTLKNNKFYGNWRKSLFFGGNDTPVAATNYETGQRYSLYLQDWSLLSNYFIGNASNQFVMDVSLSSAWSIFTNSLQSNYNDWYVTGNSTPFAVPGGYQSLSQWRSSTGQDANSTSSSASLGLPLACSAATPTPISTPTPKPIALRGFVSSSASSVKSITLSMPAGVRANDVLIAQLAAYSGAVSIQANAPAGWNQIFSKSSPTGYAREWIFYHVASSSEPIGYTWQFNRLGTIVRGAAGGIASYYNVDTTSPVDASNGQFNANSTTIKATSLTTSFANDKLLCFMSTFAGIQPSNWTTLPSWMAKEWLFENGGVNIDAGYFDQSLGAAGYVSNKTATVPAADNVGILVALKPAP